MSDSPQRGSGEHGPGEHGPDFLVIVAVLGVLFVAADVVLYALGPRQGGSSAPLIALVIVELIIYAVLGVYLRRRHAEAP